MLGSTLATGRREESMTDVANVAPSEAVNWEKFQSEYEAADASAKVAMLTAHAGYFGARPEWVSEAEWLGFVQALPSHAS